VASVWLDRGETFEALHTLLSGGLRIGMHECTASSMGGIVFLASVWLDRGETIEALHTLLSGRCTHRHAHTAVHAAQLCV
jgi:Zn-finger nucleic acid-binding protein